MRYWIYHQGIPLGSVNFTPGELAIGDFDAATGYEAVRAAIRHASEGLWAMGFFHPEGALHRRVPAEVFGHAARLPLELRDDNQRQIPADFVNIVERPHATERPVVFARFRHAHAGVAGRLPPKSAGGSNASDADA